MGNLISQEPSATERLNNLTSILSKRCFVIDRLLAAECDFITNTNNNVIRLGIFGKSSDHMNPLHRQGIRIGDDDIHGLKNFVKNENGLQYEFEENISLNVFKRDSDVCYRLKTPALDVTRKINPAVVKFFKTIEMSDVSREIDALATILK